MTPERWQQIERLYNAALERDASQRAAFLDGACGGDEALRQDIKSLLAREQSAEGFLVTPAAEAVAKAMAEDAVPSLIGRQLGPYKVLSLLGAGGMGEVYRARDTKLGREVALKVVSDGFVHDLERVARFQREAHLLAALNHPHIAAIYGLENVNGVQCLILELVEGDTLADRLRAGPLPLAETVAIARQVADALQAAHEKGIIHRDLKPSNIALTHDGQVKVLDFGLAKAITPAEAGLSGRGGVRGPAVFDGAEAREAEHDVPNLTASPTITTPAQITDAGMILGTAAYMAPEQAKGRPADKRCDVWAFGCVFYEMLTGKRAFDGEDVGDTLAAVLRGEPDWAALPAEVPAVIRALLHRCLTKDRRQRIADIAVALFVLDESESVAPASAAPISSATIAPRPPLWRRMAILSSTWLIGVAMAGAAAWFATRATIPPPTVSRFLITPPSAAALTVSGFSHDLALTPDGARLVYVGANGAALFVRALDQLDVTPLTGLGAPIGPFVSPDGQWIGFFDGASALKKVAIAGGPAVTLGRTDSGSRGASWGADGSIIFATLNLTTGLQRIAAAGGEPTVLTRPNPASGEADHLWPEILPGGQAVLFTITATTGGLDQAQVAVLDLRTGVQTVLIRGGSDARYVSSGLASPTRAEREGGHLVYAAAGTLRAVAFDLARLAVVGTPVPVLSGVETTPGGAADAAVASDGTLVYLPSGGLARGVRSLVWVDRQGQETPMATPPRTYTYPRLSPDGTRLALHIADQELDLWLWDLARATLTRISFAAGFDTYPVWTPDGRQLLFSSDRAGARNLFAQAADGTGAITRLTESPNWQEATSVSPDGTRLVFMETAPTRAPDVMQLRLDGTHAVTPLVQTLFTEQNGEVSPDGRWLAYEANDSGRFEIYVRPFPDVSSGHWQVSTDGGTRPLWARNSQELFYLTPTGALVRVGVKRGPIWAATAPTKLFEGRYGTGPAFTGRTYDVSSDGRRFLMIKPVGPPDATGAPASVVVVQHWTEELKRLVPVN